VAAKQVKEPADAVKEVTPTTAPAVTPPPPTPFTAPPEPSTPVIPADATVNPADVCTWEKLGEPGEEIVFLDGTKFKFPTKIFETADLKLSGKINQVRKKYQIEPRSYNYGRSE
jgi:hypothetical protein